MARQHQYAGEAVASLRHPMPHHPHSQHFVPLQPPTKVSSYPRPQPPRTQDWNTLTQTELSSSKRELIMPQVRQFSPPETHTFLTNRSASLPSSLSEPLLPIATPPSSLGRTQASPYRAPNKATSQSKSLATVRLMPISSRVPSTDGEENPLDRHRHSDVLLNATQPLSNTLVTRRVQQVASSNTTTQLEG
ncbi:uncharacterized protein LOC108677474, partial [Hyalella azteca]|uniref:Uncharacterized protein LOC108677474 n=1 Tax=Hyalella azteca TaxID=294128 RepID=A0A8B7P560_HYAAZ